MSALLTIYATAFAISGFHGPRPQIVYAPSIRTYAYAAEYQQHIYVTADIVADASGDKWARATVASALLHELAHAYQAAGLTTWEAEGGAEAFSRDKDWQVFGVLPQHWAYSSWVRRVVRQLGTRWIRHGQFVTGTL